MFCWKCGEKIEENSNFCPSCGAKFTGQIESDSDESSKKKLLEQKAWYRALKVFYLFIAGVTALIIIGSFWSDRPKTKIDNDKSFITCSNGISYPLAPNELSIPFWSTEFDSYDDKDARVLCEYNVLNSYSHSNETIAKNYRLNLIYDHPTFSDWVDWIKGLIFASAVFWLIAYLIKSGFFYISIGEKPKIRWLEKIYKSQK